MVLFAKTIAIPNTSADEGSNKICPKAVQAGLLTVY
jgi:hypothetical protein